MRFEQPPEYPGSPSVNFKDIGFAWLAVMVRAAEWKGLPPSTPRASIEYISPENNWIANRPEASVETLGGMNEILSPLFNVLVGQRNRISMSPAGLPFFHTAMPEIVFALKSSGRVKSKPLILDPILISIGVASFSSNVPG